MNPNNLLNLTRLCQKFQIKMKLFLIRLHMICSVFLDKYVNNNVVYKILFQVLKKRSIFAQSLFSRLDFKSILWLQMIKPYQFFF